MKTAMQQALDWIDSQTEGFTFIDVVHLKSNLANYLQTERKQIERAYDWGVQDLDGSNGFEYYFEREYGGDSA